MTEDNFLLLAEGISHGRGLIFILVFALVSLVFLFLF